MKKTILLLLCIVVYKNSAQIKTFTLPLNENTRFFEVSENWIVANTITDDMQIFNTYAISPDLTINNRIYSGRREVLHTYPIDELKSLVLITVGSEESPYYEVDYEIDSIRAYDPNNGNIKWQTTSKGGFYILSPNKKYLSTSSDNSNENDVFELIDLTDGTKLTLNNDLKGCYSNWLDDERLLIMCNRREYSEEYLKIKNVIDKLLTEYRKYREQCDVIVRNIKSKKMPKDEGMKEITKLNITFEGIADSISTYEKKMERFDYSNKWTRKTARLIIYNIKSRLFEKDELVNAEEGQAIIVGEPTTESMNAIQIDKNQNIYIWGKILNNKQSERFLIKTTREGKMLWKKKLDFELRGRIATHYFENELYITIEKKGELFFINKTTGGIETIPEAEKNLTPRSLINQILNNEKTVKNMYKIVFDKKKGAIELLRGEEK